MSEAIDLSHHLSLLARSRKASPLKDILAYLHYPGMVSLAGGLPHPALFPFANIDVEVYNPGSDLSSLVSSDTTHISVPKVNTEGGVSLAVALQYADVSGMRALLKYAREFTQLVCSPAYKNWDVLINCGNTDGWTKAVGLLCEPGDYILVEEYTFSSAQYLWIPMGCKGAPIKMDAEGLRADHLDEVLTTWDTTHPGVKKPHVLYATPTGQNPTGTLMPDKRKQEVYDVCVKHDIIIVEDDPYYFLQLAPYVLNAPASTPTAYSQSAHLASLEKTFLNIDVQGRVIRLDSFSKTVAPGSRIGWFTANPLFTERLLRASEVTTQTPSGWSQGIIIRLLDEWKLGGFLQWLHGLAAEYQKRRDWMCDGLAASFDVQPSTHDASLTAYLKGTQTRLFTFVPPRAGMFVWLKVFLHENKQYQEMKGKLEEPELDYEKMLWQDMADAKVLLSSGNFFLPWEGKEKMDREENVIFFRLSYSMTSKEAMQAAVQRMADVFAGAWS
ncbi:aromatic aminotransferase Aro8 [Cylindrobasidium torrendii FP15055 ss-10]|uniref:Aromatic aminotransferase Aro8 n=1 Tax=Cylindrobasidium torrendii FP15055 ss-10 TaxID=1314674 RepID=A0A0D7BLG2_9AGAR|nr:aromatic aminotransferase Aro8 [Cylindrobasidium torrendii FP15055 ss-10]